MTDRETLAQRAYDNIKQDILNGGIPGGTILSERVLAERTHISRTPLRAALSRLEREGVVGRLSNGALTVRPVSAEQFLDVLALRRVLEGAAAARAVMTDALEASAKEMQRCASGEAMDFDTFWAMDDRFHTAVVRAAGLSLLPAILDEQRAVARRSTIVRRLDVFTDQGHEHLAVIDAIRRGDPAGAAAAAHHHFDCMRARFLHNLQR
ncbi:GntR family transcriptional regulator [Falsirhodobacter sp. 20TX0035]|uniref:GntR family transcriptional regulator n=1 Tax=Falsirhodobacter sp. 20TX0035 TaxID=3022019 RepID=UPI00232E6AE0|nr:GntR family transcriptional regulator [Falsirhodobacter sp. 20TX0035]MDB6454218.1 GntR family transcriptional regulator [Falsirhodobacter sp. 20TX0035]